MAAIVIGSALPVEGTPDSFGMGGGRGFGEVFGEQDFIEPAAHFAEIDVAHVTLPVEIGTDIDLSLIHI